MPTKETTSPDSQGLEELKEAVSKDLDGVPNKEMLIKAIFGFVDYAYLLGGKRVVRRAEKENNIDRCGDIGKPHHIFGQCFSCHIDIGSEACLDAARNELEEMRNE